MLSIALIFAFCNLLFAFTTLVPAYRSTVISFCRGRAGRGELLVSPTNETNPPESKGFRTFH